MTYAQHSYTMASSKTCAQTSRNWYFCLCFHFEITLNALVFTVHLRWKKITCLSCRSQIISHVLLTLLEYFRSIVFHWAIRHDVERGSPSADPFRPPLFSFTLFPPSPRGLPNSVRTTTSTTTYSRALSGRHVIVKLAWFIVIVDGLESLRHRWNYGGELVSASWNVAKESASPREKR